MTGASGSDDMGPPDEMRSLAPGRYVLQPFDRAPLLTAERRAGLEGVAPSWQAAIVHRPEHAHDRISAGQGLPLSNLVIALVAGINDAGDGVPAFFQKPHCVTRRDPQRGHPVA